MITVERVLSAVFRRALIVTHWSRVDGSWQVTGDCVRCGSRATRPGWYWCGDCAIELGQR